MPILKSVLAYLVEQRELLIAGMYWLADLQPFYFMLFCCMYGFGFTFLLGLAIFAKVI